MFFRNDAGDFLPIMLQSTSPEMAQLRQARSRAERSLPERKPAIDRGRGSPSQATRLQDFGTFHSIEERWLWFRWRRDTTPTGRREAEFGSNSHHDLSLPVRD
jgi:hypothetical protein